jgi:methylmalonyl-CoA/ethylmalonyl-CoA epimerase
MVIDHIGIVVKSIEKSINYWEEIFNYNQMTEIVINSIQKVRVVFLSKKDSMLIKLIEPLDESSSVYRYAMKGGGLHHLCFKCDDISAELDKFKEMGLRILAEPQPGEAFENENIAFFYAKDGLNIELIDTTKKAKRIFHGH